MAADKSDITGHEVPLSVVLPFYGYASLCLLVSCLLLFFSTGSLNGHHFQPILLAIVHTMALGWGTMTILGASYQLIPVLIESKLKSNPMAKTSFFLAGLGIPLLVYGFYSFQLGWLTQLGGTAINLAVLLFWINLAWSAGESKTDHIHTVFVLTASGWLLLTTLWGLLLLFNFTMDIFPQDSLYYLSAHSHIGIVGWFILFIMGVGSKLVPMFLVSKYTNDRLLWLIYGLVNMALILFILMELNPFMPYLSALSLGMFSLGLFFFFFYCWKAFQQRVRKKIDPQMKLSMSALGMILLPLVILLILMNKLELKVIHPSLVTAYGFTIFFGWLSAIILAMTFKALPSLVWSNVYRFHPGKHHIPNPKDLFSPILFNWTVVAYTLGFIGVLWGMGKENVFLLKTGAGSLIVSALLYIWNVLKVIFHQPQNHETRG